MCYVTLIRTYDMIASITAAMTRAVKGGCERSAAFGNFTTFSNQLRLQGSEGLFQHVDVSKKMVGFPNKNHGVFLLKMIITWGVKWGVPQFQETSIWWLSKIISSRNGHS